MVRGFAVVPPSAHPAKTYRVPDPPFCGVENSTVQDALVAQFNVVGVE
jgi:hypothetical protein